MQSIQHADVITVNYSCEIFTKITIMGLVELRQNDGIRWQKNGWVIEISGS
jgi:hypothetical protein